MDFSDKYVVFKSEDFERVMLGDLADIQIPPADYTVIRHGDIFAGPALHAYAASIGIVVEVLRASGQEVPQSLLDTADYFHEAALTADAYVPRRFPT